MFLLFHEFVVFCAAEEEASCAVVLEVGNLRVGERLAGGGILAGALRPTEEAVGMHTVAYESLPGTITNGTVDVGLEESLLDATCHTIEEECGARHLLAAIVGIRNEAGVP